MGRYMSKEVTELSCEKSMYEEVRITGFGINGIVAVPPSVGRCFIEVTSMTHSPFLHSISRA